MTEPNKLVSRMALAEAIGGLVLIVLAFAAIAASDVSPLGTHVYWVALVAIYGAATLVADRLHTDHSLAEPRSALAIVLHWLGVYAAIQLIYYFIGSGRMANADTGLANGVILALGMFTAGTHVNWRLMVVGAALGAATASVAFVEEYLWVMFGLAALALVLMVAGTRVAAQIRRRRSDAI